MLEPESFQATYNAEPAEMVIGGRTYRIFTPRSIERYLYDGGTLNGFPLWAKVWPASLVLAEMLAGTPPDPRREMIEIGGGLGHVSVVAAACGHRITFSETNPHALAFARASAQLNGVPQMHVVRLDWSRPSIPRQFDLVLGSELIYREADILPLQRLFVRLLKPEGEILLAGEVRGTTDAFLRQITESFHVQFQRRSLCYGPQSTTVLVFRMQLKS
jgi:2-polyprenyl-3-methyl-5-hydroxy-6-metoxy-1,4-benzoquinol methylase